MRQPIGASDQPFCAGEPVATHSFRELWIWQGKVSRQTYALVGTIGFALKLGLDHLIAGRVFGYTSTWYFLYYSAPLGPHGRPQDINRGQSQYLLTMFAVAVPFIWLGLAMTVKRLRDAGQPVWLAILFFIPFVNFLLFAILCCLPPRERGLTEEAEPWPHQRGLAPFIPRSQFGSALLAIALSAFIGLFFAVIGSSVVQTYGWSLFVGLPFCMAMFAVLLHSYHGPRSYGACMSVAILPIALLGALLLLIAAEGLICILMAAPIGLVLSWFGGSCGYCIQAVYWSRRQSGAIMSVVLVLLPVSFGAERASNLQPPHYVVRSAIDVNAPPQVVWQQVVTFAEIAPPDELLFRSGIAYPIRAEITGSGVGAVRHCIFSTGAFTEPIEIWDEPRLLKFGVTATPAPLNELTPYGHIEPHHLHGYFTSEEGQFLLTRLANGGTRLEGTTRYRDAIWPAAYWRLWSDYIIHRINMRVLTHIQKQAEAVSSAGMQK